MLSIRKGGFADAKKFLQLLHEVKDSMENPEWFFLDPDDEVRAMLQSGTMQLWVAEDGDRLAGTFDILYPGLLGYNYGYDLGLSREELLRVVQMDAVAVHPDYRGLGLQKKLMEQAERQILSEPGRILLCTVHPDNCYSLENVLKQGYSIVSKQEKYGSMRYFLRKDLA